MKESRSMDSSTASDTHSLRVTFRDVDSAYALFHTFMPDDLGYFTRVARKREGASHVSSTRRPDPPANGSKLPLGKRGQPPARRILRREDFSFMKSGICATM
jgi:hypothetical protein